MYLYFPLLEWDLQGSHFHHHLHQQHNVHIDFQLGNNILQRKKRTFVTLFGKRGIKVNLENNVLTRLIGFVEKRGNAFCMRLNRFLMRLNNRLCCTSILHFVCWKVS